MTFDEKVEQAVISAEPVLELRNLAVGLASDGHDQKSILEMFESARQKLIRARRERDEEAVTDAMDFIVGWCSAHMKVFPPN
jgi:hypothetical protein